MSQLITGIQAEWLPIQPTNIIQYYLRSIVPSSEHNEQHQHYRLPCRLPLFFSDRKS